MCATFHEEGCAVNFQLSDSVAIFLIAGLIVFGAMKCRRRLVLTLHRDHVHIETDGETQERKVPSSGRDLRA